MPVDLEKLLQPIPGDNPSGQDLRYEPVYGEIKEARREEDDNPQGDWATERKVADWQEVIKLATESLATQSKDLQLAAWLTEGLLRKEGYGGLRSGLELIKGLLENFWDTLYPEVEDGDLELRSAPLSWLGLKTDMTVRRVPLVRGGYDFIRYEESLSVGFEADATDRSRSEARNQKIEEGKLSGEEWEKAFTETPKANLKQTVADINASVALVAEIDKIGDKFEDAAPSYTVLKKALEDVQRLANTLLKNKLAVDPDPIEEVALAGVEGGEGAVAMTGDGTLTAEPVSREDAVGRVTGAARWLRQNDPLNPAPYLMLRGLRWGEVRANAGHLEPRLLVAPTTPLRSQLKSLLLDSKWAALLEACESAMAQPCGRGWLDLQRYAIVAASQLGKEYYPVEMALRAAFKAYLEDMPEIAQATMMDDTPAANSETLQWIASEFGDGAGAAPGSARHRDGTPFAGGDARESEALDLARAGRTEDAVSLLARLLEQEHSMRGRFRLRTQLCSILVDAGCERIAQPILEELMSQVDAYKLEEWESGPTVAEPMGLLIKVLTKFEMDEETRNTLYLRICKLDPNLALKSMQ
jgi:type VI secretion system protein ImpA